MKLWNCNGISEILAYAQPKKEYFAEENIDPCLSLWLLLLLPLDPGGLVHGEPPLLLVARPRLGRLHRRLDLLSLGHSFEEPSSRLLPQLSALSADLAEPGCLLKKEI